jgi:protease YdgD
MLPDSAQLSGAEHLLTVVYDVADIGVYRPWVKSRPTGSPEEENPMRRFSAVIGLGAMAFLTFGLRAEESTTGSHSTPASLLPGISADDPRIRVDPDVMPWRAVGKLQAASMNFRASCTATLVGPSTVVTAAHCIFNHRVQRYFPPAALHFLIGYTGSRYAGHAIGTAIKISDGYDPDRPKETVGSDWALVSLDKHLGSEGRVLPILSELPENGAKVALGGYQKDHSLVLMADTRCHIVGRFVDADGRLLLRHDCAATNGTSGAPLLIDRGGRWQVAAIEVLGEAGIAGGAAAVLDEAIKQLVSDLGR